MCWRKDANGRATDVKVELLIKLKLDQLLRSFGQLLNLAQTTLEYVKQRKIHLEALSLVLMLTKTKLQSQLTTSARSHGQEAT